MLIAGLGGVDRYGCVALAADDGRLLGVCGQERVTRLRGAGFNASGLPDEALDVLLNRLGYSRQEVARYVIAEVQSAATGGRVFERIDHHFAHACTAYLTSPFSSAAIVVCDHDAPKVSVWKGQGAKISPVEWPWIGPGFADIYSEFSTAFGFSAEAGDQRLEALARLHTDGQDAPAMRISLNGETSVSVDPALAATIEARLSGERNPGSPARAALAASLQARLAEVFLEFLGAVRRQTGCEQVCLAGSFFYHSSINTRAKRAGLFADVFVPIDPGNGGLAVGTALHASGAAPRPVSPFLGPAYSGQETKETLDNCKLRYEWESEDELISMAVRALQHGTLVGWFSGAMEWGPRALGARCILANPFAPYVLDNLNQFLKRRESWRGYAISGPDEAVKEHFDGPVKAPFMESDYRPRDAALFANVVPSPTAAIRVQTVGTDAPPRFRRLLKAFGAAAGLPFLVNTSFNGFHEPIVCSPRDAVRVFYGTGLDLLVLDEFVLTK